MAMFVPVLVTMRHVTLSCAGGAKCFTGWPSISTIVSPGRKPAFHAGPARAPGVGGRERGGGLVQGGAEQCLAFGDRLMAG